MPESLTEIDVSVVEIVDESPLNKTEEDIFADQEKVIGRSLKSFIECGNAFAIIKSQRLYRQSHSNFDVYVQERWGMSAAHAYRNIAAAQVAAALPEGAPAPSSESQTRLLSRLEPEERAEVWEEAIERSNGAPATAATVAEVMMGRGHAVPASALPKDRPLREVDGDGGSKDRDVRLTPPDAIARILAALGAIDLDPCSNSMDKPNVPASAHFDAKKNGLLKTRRWTGRVFMNPPYSTPLAWVERLVTDFQQGEVDEAIALLPVDSTTKWWDLISGASSAIALPKTRLKFLTADGGVDGSARFASVFFYLGKFGPTDFVEAFSGDGFANIYLPSRSDLEVLNG
jgi:DNA N-6-adenine-methyltransferase (Dam)